MIRILVATVAPWMDNPPLWWLFIGCNVYFFSFIYLSGPTYTTEYGIFIPVYLSVCIGVLYFCISYFVHPFQLLVFWQNCDLSFYYKKLMVKSECWLKVVNIFWGSSINLSKMDFYSKTWTLNMVSMWETPQINSNSQLCPNILHLNELQIIFYLII